MEVFHLCRLCLKTGSYHFNIFTEIISNKHLYQSINNICELGIFRNDGLPEHICENCFHSIRSIISFKTQAKETEAALTRMMILTIKREKEVVDHEEAVDSAFDQSTVNEIFIKEELIDLTSTSQDHHKLSEDNKGLTESQDCDRFGSNLHENIQDVYSEDSIEEIDAQRNPISEEENDGDIFSEASFEEIPVPEEEIETHDLLEDSFEEINARKNQISEENGSHDLSKVTIKSEIDIDEVGIPDELLERQEISEKEASSSSKHLNEKKIISLKKENCESQEFSEESRELKCQQFGEKRDTMEEIVQHIQDSHTPQLMEEVIAQKRKQGEHICPFCGRRSNGKANLIIHIRVHTKEKPFECKLCSFRSAQSGTLSKHMKKHTGEKPFRCSKCSFSCAFQQNLTDHMIRHTGVKSHMCDVCGYRCFLKGQLRMHMFRHSGLKPIKCHLCSFRCSQRISLTRHNLSMHSVKKPS